MRSILGECTGKVRSTPTPNDCLRTVNVSRTPLPWRLMHDALEDLRAAPGALDDLEVNAHAIARLEGRDSAQLRPLDAVDHAGHRHKKRDRWSRRAWTDHGSEGSEAWTVPAAERAGARAALLQPPFADPRVVARQEHLRHLVPAPVERARVVRVLRRPLERLAERLLDRALLVPERARQLPDHRVGHHHRRQLAARQDVRADRDHVGGEVLVHALVEALVAPRQQRERGLCRQLGGERVVELASAPATARSSGAGAAPAP